MINRRAILRAFTAGAALTNTGISVQSRETLELPKWRYGTSSSADGTVFMFRGNGAHTFYGTGPIPDAQHSIRWRFRTSTIRNTVRGKRIIWSGTGWSGTAISLGGYVFLVRLAVGFMRLMPVEADCSGNCVAAECSKVRLRVSKSALCRKY